MKAVRPIGGFQFGLPHPLNKRVLNCSGDIRDEVLASIDMYAEIKDAGMELLKTNGHQNLSQAYLRFQAYVRQAKTFYVAAETLHHRAAPLNYYYSFLNFAKALIFLRTPTFTEHKLHHGITTDPISEPLREQDVRISSDGALPRFYKLVTDQPISTGAKLKVNDLIGYCSDVEYEYIQLEYGEHVTFPCRLVLGMDAPEKYTNVFAIIAVHNGTNPAFEKLRGSIEQNFQEVDIAKSVARDIFDMLAPERSATRFFESKKEWKSQTTIGTLTADLVSMLGNLISYVPFDEQRLFLLNCPVKTPELVPMQEIIAIYCFMFFLGSLVRYRPELLENMLSTKDAWIIERFTKSAPLTFLRLIRNLFDGEYLAYASR